MSRVACAVAIALLALGCDRAGSARPEPASTTVAAPARAEPSATSDDARASLPRIVFLGDSLTAGLGIGKDQAVPALIGQRLRREGYAYDVVNAGNSGDTSDGGLTRLDWSLQGDVAVLVVELGANDGLRGIPPDHTRQNLESIIETARQRGITVLLTGMEAPPNYGPAYTAEFRKTFRQVAEHERVAFMPFFLEGVAGIRSLNQADGVHPTPEGARIIADNLWRYLQPLLKKTKT
jgi:acyl-CoA thioesterase-1